MGKKEKLVTDRQTQSQTFKTETKDVNIEMTNMVMGMEDMSAEKNISADDFPKLSTIPGAASKKDGGILGFFKKKDITSRSAPEDHDNNAGENAVKNAEVMDGKLQRAIVDLTEEERGGRAVSMMRAQKKIFVERARADLKKKRDVPLSKFTKGILENLKSLGKRDISPYSDRDTRNYVRNKEMEAGKKCLPFLMSYIKDIDELEADHKNPVLIQSFESKYGHISKDEQNLLRIYAELLRDSGGMLDTKGLQLPVTGDDRMAKGRPVDLLNEPKRGMFHRRSELRFDDKSDVPLFLHKPNIYDMKQGDIGNCYMIAALISIIDANPDEIINCMKDNGDTVTVRFYRNQQPVYITVKKSIPYREFEGVDKTGNEIKRKVYSGASGALWVNMMEKAYAVFCAGGDYNKLEHADKEGASDFIFALTQRGVKSTELYGDMNDYSAVEQLPTKVEVTSLVKDARKSARADFEEKLRKEGRLPASKSERNLLWNKEKARMFFGITAQEYYSYNLSEMFRKNTAFDKWSKVLKKKMKEFSQSGVRSITELGMVLGSLKETEFPKLGIRGLNEEKMRKHYIKAMIKVITEKEKLFSIGNDYRYSYEEASLYEKINKARKKGTFITTGTSRLRFRYLQDKKLEHDQEGIFGQHSYTILGTREKDINVNGKTLKRLFVIVSNPWLHGSRIYDSNGMGHEQYEVMNNDDTIAYNNHGIFLMELKDFYNSFASVEFQ